MVLIGDEKGEEEEEEDGGHRMANAMQMDMEVERKRKKREEGRKGRRSWATTGHGITRAGTAALPTAFTRA